MIMAWANPAPGALPCYTFGGAYRACADVKEKARTIRGPKKPGVSTRRCTAMATEPLIGEERDGTVQPKHTDDCCYGNAGEADKPGAQS